jgi:hypothetical protein
VVANLDLPTTILAVAGIPRTDTDGQNLELLLRNPRRPWREEIFIENYGLVHQTWAGVRTQRYKYVEWASGHKVLFDLFKDTYELHNKIDDPAYQPIRQELVERLRPLKGLAIIGATRLNGKVHRNVVLPLTAWGGTEPYRWTIIQGEVPPGMTFDGDAGLFTGTPTQAGTFQVHLQVRDASVSPYSMQPQAHNRYFTFVIKP